MCLVQIFRKNFLSFHHYEICYRFCVISFIRFMHFCSWFAELFSWIGVKIVNWTLWYCTYLILFGLQKWHFHLVELNILDFFCNLLIILTFFLYVLNFLDFWISANLPFLNKSNMILIYYYSYILLDLFCIFGA